MRAGLSVEIVVMSRTVTDAPVASAKPQLYKSTSARVGRPEPPAAGEGAAGATGATGAAGAARATGPERASETMGAERAS